MIERGGNDRDPERPDRLRIRPILAEVAAGYRYDWKLLLGAGLLVFVPIGLLTAVDPLEGRALDEWNGWSVAVLLLIAAQASIPLLGALFYSGAVAAGEARRRGRGRRGLREVARGLRYRTLIVADIVLVFVTAFGLLALIVPGLVFITWFSLIAPAVEVEGLGVRAGFRRSRAMVRPHFWRVAAVVIPLAFLQAILEGRGAAAGHALLGDGYLGNLLASVISNLLGSPLYALTVLALYYEIRARER